MKDNTDRFTGRVSDYSKYRPSYPDETVDYLVSRCCLNGKKNIADIGSGTGKFTRLILPHCGKVFAVEPNDDMRRAAEQSLGKHANFISVNGTAEHTTLADSSVDCITVAQAIHWFDPDTTVSEFKRILKPSGKVAIVVNKRVFSTRFLEEYERSLRELIPEYAEVNHYNIKPETVRRFCPNGYESAKFEYRQEFDWDGLMGRLRSSSYTPKSETPEFKVLESRIKNLFGRHSKDGTVIFEYETIVESGQFD